MLIKQELKRKLTEAKKFKHPNLDYPFIYIKSLLELIINYELITYMFYFQIMEFQ